MANTTKVWRNPTKKARLGHSNFHGWFRANFMFLNPCLNSACTYMWKTRPQQNLVITMEELTGFMSKLKSSYNNIPEQKSCRHTSRITEPNSCYCLSFLKSCCSFVSISSYLLHDSFLSDLVVRRDLIDSDFLRLFDDPYKKFSTLLLGWWLTSVFVGGVSLSKLLFTLVTRPSPTGCNWRTFCVDCLDTCLAYSTTCGFVIPYSSLLSS